VAAPAVPSYVVTFEREEYLIQGGETFPVHVFISPPLPPGLFSFGIRLWLDATNACPSGVGGITVPTDLAFDGPRTLGPVLAVGTNSAAVKGTVSFHGHSLQPSTNALLATFYLTDLAPGPYQLHLGFFNTLGPTEDIFVDGTGRVLDPFISFGSAAVLRAGNPTVEVRTPITLNRQTGLFEQIVRVTNPGLAAMPSLRLLVLHVNAHWQVWNRSGFTNGTP
jgi:hypothetical protein